MKNSKDKKMRQVIKQNKNSFTNKKNAIKKQHSFVGDKMEERMAKAFLKYM